MPTSQLINGLLTGIRDLCVDARAVDGTIPAVPVSIWLNRVTQVEIQYQVEAGDRVVHAADGVGVIEVIDEDDTLTGIDVKIPVVMLDMNALHTMVGGVITSDSNITTGLALPTISQQRAAPKKFQLTVWVAIHDFQTGAVSGYLRHTFSYCRAVIESIPHAVDGISRPVLVIKVRPNPSTGAIHSMDFVANPPR